MKITDKYVLFWGEEFSNFYPTTIIYNQYIFKCSEQFFMWEKAVFFKDYEIASLIYQEGENPKRAKELGRAVKGFDETRWKNVRFSIMYKVLLYKFRQNEKLKEKLLSYGDRIFVEASPYDAIWGIGLSENDKLAEDSNNWKGLNLLGKALCLVRDYFIAYDKIKNNNGFSNDKDLVSDVLGNINIKSAIEYYGVDRILNQIDVYDAVNHYDLKEVIDSVWDKSDILDNFSEDELKEYMIYNDLIFNDSDISMKDTVVNLCRSVHPRGALLKKDIKETLNEIVDDNFYS